MVIHFKYHPVQRAELDLQSFLSASFLCSSLSVVTSAHYIQSFIMSKASRSEVLRFTVCALGICFCYWFHGALQEQLLTHSDLGATFVLVAQTVANIFVALAWQQFEERTSSNSSSTKGGSNGSSSAAKTHAPLRHPLLFINATTYVVALTCANEALRFVSYPTNVLAKSCKLIPTMVMGSLVEKRRYSFQQWASAILISGGISLFHVSRIQSSDDDEESHDEAWKGMALLSLSLIMDGFLGASQGVLKRKDETGRTRPPTAVETMLWVNLYALLLLVPMAAFDGQLWSGIEALQQDRSLFNAVLILNGVVSVGQIFIFLTITWYSSLACTTITTTRKFFTILFSVLYFGHHFAVWQWMAVGLVFAGLYLSMVAKGPAPAAAVPIKKQQHQRKLSSGALLALSKEGISVPPPSRDHSPVPGHVKAD